MSPTTSSSNDPRQIHLVSWTGIWPDVDRSVWLANGVAVLLLLWQI